MPKNSLFAILKDANEYGIIPPAWHTSIAESSHREWLRKHPKGDNEKREILRKYGGKE
jgi:hypothetical protein